MPCSDGECRECHDSASRCNRCGDIKKYTHAIDDAASYGLCWNCFKNEEVYRWDFKPRNWQAQIGENDGGRILLFGIENEASLRNQPAAFVTAARESNCYVKDDGSVTGCGVEIVTNPMTLDIVRDSFYKNMQLIYDNERTDNRVRADRLASCGLHVHMPQNAFDGPAHIYQYAILMKSELARFVSKRRSKYWNSRTAASRYCRETNFATETLQKKWFTGNVQTGYDSNRYSHVNICHNNTVETRIFQGTINPRRVIKAVEFCKLIFDVTKNKGYSETPSIDRTLLYAKQWAKDFPMLMEDLVRFEERGA